MEKITVGPMPYMSVMPTVLVGANVKGKPNYMTAAWATVACMAPPMVCVAINKARYTAKGIEENKTFSLNIPSAKLAVETDHCGLVSGAQEDKSKVFRSFYGKLKTAPMAGGMPGQYRVHRLQGRGLRQPYALHRRDRGDPCRQGMCNGRKTGYHEDQPDRLLPVRVLLGGERD